MWWHAPSDAWNGNLILITVALALYKRRFGVVSLYLVKLHAISISSTGFLVTGDCV